MNTKQAESIFLKSTRDKFFAMQKRCQAKYGKSGRLLRAPIPFTLTLETFRAWALEQFRTCDGIARCAYCTRPVTIDTFTPDHEIALKRGGSSGTDNLAVSCADCNGIKGMCSKPSFMLLIACLQRMPPADANDITGRLLKSEKLASLVRRNAMRNRKPAMTEEAQC